MSKGRYTQQFILQTQIFQRDYLTLVLLCETKLYCVAPVYQTLPILTQTHKKIPHFASPHPYIALAYLLNQSWDDNYLFFYLEFPSKGEQSVKA